jgi:isopenicillin-N epimerase
MTSPIGRSGLDRRRFLTGLVATSAVACAPKPAVTPAVPALPADRWRALRGEFELAPGRVHLGGFLLASHPRVVREAIERYRRALDVDPVHALHETEGSWRVHEAAAKYMGVAREEIALTDSTTMGLALLYAGLPLRAGDDVVTTTHDHYSTHESLRLVAERTGAVVRRIPLYGKPAEASEGGMADAIARAIVPATRLVAITWVHSSTGVKTPVRAIAEVVAKANAARPEKERILLCVDGVHGFGAEGTTMPELGCDFFVAGCHKWLFGPRGTGLIWGKPQHWARLRPTIPHFGLEAFEAWMEGKPPPPTNASMMTPGGFHSFEHRWALAEAFELHVALGPVDIATRIHALATRLKDGLATMKHVALHTPRAAALSAGIVCFEVDKLEPKQVVERLEAKKITATTTPYKPSYARLATSLFNDEADVDAALAAMRALA